MEMKPNMTDTDFNNILFVFNAVLPDDAGIPPSLYLLRAQLGVPELEDFKVHVCDAQGCTGHVFNDGDEECGACGAARFTTSTVGHVQRLLPGSYSIYFGESRLGDLIQQFYDNQVWVGMKEEEGRVRAAAAANRSTAPPGSFYRSEEFDRLLRHPVRTVFCVWFLLRWQ